MDLKSYPLTCEEMFAEAERLLGEMLVCDFGIPYLDDTLRGLAPGEVTLLGAATGAGKTEIATNIMLEQQTGNKAKSVLYIAMDHEKGEIERRVLWRMIMELAAKDGLQKDFRYVEWTRGSYPELSDYRRNADLKLKSLLAMSETRFIYQKGNMHWKEVVNQVSERHGQEFNLIIVDHFHSMQGMNSLAEQEAAITALCNNANKINRPVLLCAQFRKKNGRTKNPIPDMDDFSGSSQLRYQPQNIIVVAPDYSGDAYQTFFHIVKSRNSADSKPFVGIHGFNNQTKLYSKKYRLARYNPFDAPELLTEKIPSWAKNVMASQIEEVRQKTYFERREE